MNLLIADRPDDHVAHPQHGVLATPTAGDRKPSQWLLKYLAVMLGMGLPLLFGILAVNGYYYTAVNLEADVFGSLLVVGAGASGATCATRPAGSLATQTSVNLGHVRAGGLPVFGNAQRGRFLGTRPPSVL